MPVLVCYSRVHLTPAPASAHTNPDSLSFAGWLLVPFAVVTLFRCSVVWQLFPICQVILEIGYYHLARE